MINEKTLPKFANIPLDLQCKRTGPNTLAETNVQLATGQNIKCLFQLDQQFGMHLGNFVAVFAVGTSIAAAFSLIIKKSCRDFIFIKYLLRNFVLVDCPHSYVNIMRFRNFCRLQVLVGLDAFTSAFIGS